MQSAEHTAKLYQCISLAAFGFMAWTVGDAAVRFLNFYSIYVVAFISTLTTVIILTVLSPRLGGFSKTFKMPKLKLRIGRGVIISIAGFLAYPTFQHLEMTKAYAIIFLAPILSKIFSVVFNSEKISLTSWIISILGFIGVLIVLRPGAIPLDIGSISALGLAIFFALGYVMGRTIGPENQTFLSLAFFQYFIIASLTAYPAISEMSQEGFHMPLIDLTLIVVIGITAVAGGLCVSYGFANAPSAKIAPLHYTQILWGTLWGAVMFDEYPDMLTLVGAAVIIVSGLAIIWKTDESNRKKWGRQPTP
tara:strand:+ start:2449 stop:3366 length:918 start_codon:yes stop_codon:yes gene_type:complete